MDVSQMPTLRMFPAVSHASILSQFYGKYYLGIFISDSLLMFSGCNRDDGYMFEIFGEAVEHSGQRINRKCTGANLGVSV